MSRDSSLSHASIGASGAAAAYGAAALARAARLLAAVLGKAVDTRQRQIDALVARRIAQSGGRLTDDIERRIMRDIEGGGFGVR